MTDEERRLYGRAERAAMAYGSFIARRVSNGQGERVTNVRVNSAKVRTPRLDYALRCVVVRVHNPVTKQSIRLNALLDDGANLTTVSRCAAAVIRLKGERAKTTIAGYGGKIQVEDCERCDIVVESCFGKHKHGVEATVVRDPTGDLQAPNWKELAREWPHLRELPFHEPLGNGQVDMIIGTDVTTFHNCEKEVRGPWPTDPVARFGPAGITVVGPVRPREDGSSWRMVAAESAQCRLSLKWAEGVPVVANTEDRQALI